MYDRTLDITLERMQRESDAAGPDVAATLERMHRESDDAGPDVAATLERMHRESDDAVFGGTVPVAFTFPNV